MFQVRPQIPELTCFVQMSNGNVNTANYIDLPVDTFSNRSNDLKHANSFGRQHQGATTVLDIQHQQLDFENESIEYMPNDLDESNIQGNRSGHLWEL